MAPAPDRFEVRPVDAPLSATIRPPGSKSITNRACICAALAPGTSVLEGALASEDTEVMVEALRTLGLDVVVNGNRLTISGGLLEKPLPNKQLYCANSGTTIRFLTAALAAVGGNFELDGVPRMRERPIAGLIQTLTSLGASVTASPNGCPPVHIDGETIRGGTAEIEGNISSQYLSGLLMAAPVAKGTVRLEVRGQLVSKPYVAMTIAVMESFGVRTRFAPDLRWFEIEPQKYQPRQYAIEPDASAASYFWAAAAITGGSVTVEGLSFDALQGDVEFCRVLEQMGCRVEVDRQRPAITVVGGDLRGLDVDMNAISDTVQTLAAVALFARGETIVRGVAHNRHKETDRIGDLARELRKFGAEVTETDDGLVIVPPPIVRAAEVETYNDHRMAMSLALPGLRTKGVTILNPGCTAKTYPGYWDDLRRIYTA